MDGTKSKMRWKTFFICELNLFWFDSNWFTPPAWPDYGLQKLAILSRWNWTFRIINVGFRESSDIFQSFDCKIVQQMINKELLFQVDPNNPVWKSAMNDVGSAEWRVGSIVAMIQWVEDLVRDKMPTILKQALLARTTVDVTSDDDTYSDLPSDVTRVNIRDLSITEAAELAQWSDLVVFDYLTANYDRVSSMQVRKAI